LDPNGQDQLSALFRRESGRMTSALVRLFGPHNLPLAEDVVHDALCRALEVWKYSGIPDNPAAWLMTAAKNRAIDVLRRERSQRDKAGDLEYAIASEAALRPAVEDAFADDALRDEQLRMMFACCHARLAEEVQVALVLNLLCGFGVGEIAGAFLVSEAAMEKRLQRGKHVLGESRGLPEVTPERVAENLETVHGALYLLFNEGYHGNQPVETVRVELCAEAIRLGALLAGAPGIATPATHALLALMCLVAARLPGRLDPNGDLVPLREQDRGTWDQALVRLGIAELNTSATGDEISPFHLEAAIAYEHTIAPAHAETNWTRIVTLYDSLRAVRPSPVVALSRAIAVGELEGPLRALEELAEIPDRERLERSPFYAAAVGEEQLRAGELEGARTSFKTALTLARSPAERRYLELRLTKCA
jgi:RNA polymerase sigma factor (sigma-70 family)